MHASDMSNIGVESLKSIIEYSKELRAPNLQSGHVSRVEDSSVSCIKVVIKLSQIGARFCRYMLVPEAQSKLCKYFKFNS